jgi:phenylacetic acid degradation operon negative regulatory protein
MPPAVRDRSTPPAPSQIPAAAARDSGRGPALTRRHNVGAASARSHLLTVLGEFVLPTGEPVWTSSLVRVLGGLGIEEKASRQAMGRAAAEGWIAGAREGRRARWELTPPGRRLLTEGAERIYSFAAEGPAWDGRWVVLTLTVPETQRQLRHRLRTRLSWAGFGSPAPGVWVTTSTAREAEAHQIVRELGLDDAAFSFVGAFGDIGSAKGLVDQAWSLGAVADHYRAFLAGFAGIRPAPGDETLLTQVRLVHEWRRFPFLDPQLPAALLPADWIGRRAAAVFRDLHGSWRDAALRRWRDIQTTAGADGRS